jgi:hypothetical protein
MMHITFADKNFVVGDEAATTTLKYAAMLARDANADTVTLHAISSDGDEVDTILLLDAGAPLMAETVHSSVPEPDNAVAVSYMNVQMERFLGSNTVVPDDAAEIEDTDYHQID